MQSLGIIAYYAYAGSRSGVGHYGLHLAGGNGIHYPAFTAAELLEYQRAERVGVPALIAVLVKVAFLGLHIEQGIAIGAEPLFVYHQAYEYEPYEKGYLQNAAVGYGAYGVHEHPCQYD